jgi:hypothetical protein
VQTPRYSDRRWRQATWKSSITHYKERDLPLPFKMPGKQHVRGVGAKEQREYEHIKESAEKSGRYGKRAAEVAARTVLKQHREKGHKKGR